jgi:hypothetical protein
MLEHYSDFELFIALVIPFGKTSVPLFSFMNVFLQVTHFFNLQEFFISVNGRVILNVDMTAERTGYAVNRPFPLAIL